MSQGPDPSAPRYRRVEWGNVSRSHGPTGGTHFSVTAGADVARNLPKTVERDGKTYRLVNHAPHLGASAMYISND